MIIAQQVESTRTIQNKEHKEIDNQKLIDKKRNVSNQF